MGCRPKLLHSKLLSNLRHFNLNRLCYFFFICTWHQLELVESQKSNKLHTSLTPAITFLSSVFHASYLVRVLNLNLTDDSWSCKLLFSIKCTNIALEISNSFRCSRTSDSKMH